MMMKLSQNLVSGLAQTANLISCHENVPQFINLVMQQLEKLTANSFIAKSLSNYLRKRKENLEENEVIILGYFAEN